MTKALPKGYAGNSRAMNVKFGGKNQALLAAGGARQLALSIRKIADKELGLLKVVPLLGRPASYVRTYGLMPPARLLGFGLAIIQRLSTPVLFTLGDMSAKEHADTERNQTRSCVKQYLMLGHIW